MTQELQPDTTQLKERLLQLVNESLAVSVTSKETQEIAASKLNMIRHALKTVEFERKTWTDPLEAQKKRLIAVFKPVTEWLQSAESYLETQLNSYYAQEKEKEQKEQLRLDKLAQKRFEKAQASGSPPPFPVPISPKVEIAEKSVGGVTYITQWKARVIDQSLIPNEYMLPNDRMLDEIAKATKGTFKIPGVEFYEGTYIRGQR